MAGTTLDDLTKEYGETKEFIFPREISEEEFDKIMEFIVAETSDIGITYSRISHKRKVGQWIQDHPEYFEREAEDEIYLGEGLAGTIHVQPEKELTMLSFHSLEQSSRIRGINFDLLYPFSIEDEYPEGQLARLCSSKTSIEIAEFARKRLEEYFSEHP